MKSKIWLSPPHMSGSEINFVNQAFDTNWISPLGENIDLFEQGLNDYLNNSYSVAVSSGTAALHLGLVLLDIQPGDVVICQSLTFAASAFPIMYQKAIPVFVDSEPETWNMCPDTLKEAIIYFVNKGKKPKAVIAVHLYGMPARLQEILDICQEYEIPFVEDAAEALGGSYASQKLGSFGEFSVLSFNGNKIITTSGGGALVSRNRANSHKAKFLASQARDPAPHYQHSQVGYNYQMSNVCAGIGRGQLEVIDQRVAKRRANYDYYITAFKDLPELSFQKEPEGYLSNRWLTAVLLQSKEFSVDAIRMQLQKEEIESRPVWKPLHLQPVFASAPYFGGTVAESIFYSGICLPSGSNLSIEDLNRISFTIRSIFE